MSAREKVDLEAPTPDDDECYCDFASREYFGCFDRSHDPLCPQAEPPPQTPKEA